MKIIVSTLALTLGLMAMVQAQPTYTENHPSACPTDSVLISETTECDQIVRKYKVAETSDSDYTLHFRINLAEFSATFDQNNEEMELLNRFVERITGDKSLEIRSAIVTGYASPEGPEKFNHELAHKRASNFKQLLIKKYAIPSPCGIATHSEVKKWTDCIPAIECSAIPHKEAVLEIIRADHSEQCKEHALRNHPESWRYLKQEILPSMRRVDLTVHYAIGREVTQISKKSEESPCSMEWDSKCQSACEAQKAIDAENRDTQLVTDMIENEAHFTGKLAKKEARLTKKASRKEERMAKKLMKEEERLLRRKAKADKKAHKKVCEW